MTMNTRDTGASTVARTFALSAIDSSGAPGISTTAAGHRRHSGIRQVEHRARGELLNVWLAPMHSPAA